MEQVCQELRSLHVVQNLSSDPSVSVTCQPSPSGANEIHLTIVSLVPTLTGRMGN